MCEDCWDGHPRQHVAREVPAASPAVPREPHPAIRFLARVIAGLMLLTCVAGCLGVAVRVVAWAWPG